MPKLIKEKYKNDSFKEENFFYDMKLLGLYFIEMFNNNYTLDPTSAKAIFKPKYPNIDLTEPEIYKQINTKYRESPKINKDKIRNAEYIFSLYNNDGKNISKIINYDVNINKKIKTYKFVLIANKIMLVNYQIMV